MTVSLIEKKKSSLAKEKSKRRKEIAYQIFVNKKQIDWIILIFAFSLFNSRGLWGPHKFKNEYRQNRSDYDKKLSKFS